MTDVHAILGAARKTVEDAVLGDVNARGLARTWLVAALASLAALPTAARLAACDPGRIGTPVAATRPAATALLGLLADARPGPVAALFTRDASLLRRVLSVPPVSTAFFSGFTISGIHTYSPGARALANYALKHRGDVWSLLVWRGRHPQAPVAVAAKPHYFAELDVAASIDALAVACPDFWHSDELSAAVADGRWLALVPAVVADELFRLLHEPRSSRHAAVCRLVQEYVGKDAEWGLLCNRILPLLPEQQLLAFATLAAADLHMPAAPPQGGSSGSRGSSGSSGSRSCSAWEAWALRTQQGVHRKDTPDDLLAPGAAAQGGAHLYEAATQPLPLLATLPAAVLGSAAALNLDLPSLLLVTALGAQPGRLLAALRDDDGGGGGVGGSPLLALASAARVLLPALTAPRLRSSSTQSAFTAEQGGDASASAVSSSSAAASLAHAVRGLPAAEQLLHLLLAGWLLRLKLLLAGAAGPRALGRVLGMLGCQCQQQESRHDETPLPPAAAATMISDRGGSSVRWKSGHKRKRKRKRSRLRSSSSSGDGRDGSDGSNGCRRRQHKRPRRQSCSGALLHSSRRRHRSSGSNDSGGGSSSSGGGSGGERHTASGRHRRRRGSSSGSSERVQHDLDGNGRLLETVDFAGAESLPPRHDRSRDAEQSDSDSDRGDAARNDDELRAVLRALSAVSIGGSLHTARRWLLTLPNDVRHKGHHSSSQGSLIVAGNTVDIADAAAWHTVWRAARHQLLHDNQQQQQQQQ